MPVTLDTVISEAFQLSESQRFTLAYQVLSSVEPISTHEVETAWDVEICERIRKFDAGETKSIPASHVFKELDQRLSK